MLDLSTLNPRQREAVTTLEGPVLILAGAGTGKTRVITYRIAHLLERGVPPEHILAVTFTNKAAREMLERVNHLVPRARRPAAGATPPGPGREAPSARPTICTFHALGVRLLRRYIDRLGYKPQFVIYDEAEQLSVIRKILAQVSARGEKTDPHAVLSLLSRYRNGGERAAAFGDPEVRALAEHVRTRYESALRACNAVDFDDLLLLPLRLFREHPDVLEACRAQFRYLMVDEYQDTNAAQFELVRALAAKHRNLCVVGDDDQSIYGWRGAEPANLLELERHFPEVRVIKLEQNYRSTTTILEAANALIRHNPRRREKRLWSALGTGAKILLHTFADEEEEARAVVEQIEADRLVRRVPWSHQAVLFRTNGQARPLETALRRAGVRYHLVGGQSFFDRREVRDFLAYLRTLLNPHDDLALLRIANVPARGLSDATMQRLIAASHERHSSVFAAMQSPVVTATLPARARESLTAFGRWLEDTARPLRAAAPGFSLSAWAEGWLGQIGYYADLRRSEKTVEAGEHRVRLLQELVAALDREAGAAGTPAERLTRYLEAVTLDTEREAKETPAGDAVTLITMHSCKGLEFPHVFIVGLEEGLLPHTRAKEEGTLDEERRLFYVAITRARLTLRLGHCAARRKYGQLTPCHPSSFLKELPAELIERAEDRAREPVSPEAARAWFAAMREKLAQGRPD
jgi:superfamily I DNA/RNA helicase